MAKRKYDQKAKNHKPTTLKIGDRHPDNDNLFVILKYYHKITYGTKEQLEKRMILKREKDRIKAEKYRILKKKRLMYADREYRKGDEKEGLIFYRYKSTGKEIWLNEMDYKNQLALDQAKNNINV